MKGREAVSRKGKLFPLGRRGKILAALVLCWMAVIFGFSAKPADESSRMSLSVGAFLGAVFVPEYDDWSEARKEAFAERIDYPVRKCAHAGEYAVLGALLCLLALEQRLSVGIALAAGALYAAGDEFHQRFVPGRSCQFTDVLIDSGGVLFGILIILLFIRLFGRKAGEKAGEI